MGGHSDHYQTLLTLASFSGVYSQDNECLEQEAICVGSPLDICYAMRWNLSHKWALFKKPRTCGLLFLLGPNSEFTATTLDGASPAPGLVGCILIPSHSPEYLSVAFLVFSVFDGCTWWHSPSFLEY